MRTVWTLLVAAVLLGLNAVHGYYFDEPGGGQVQCQASRAYDSSRKTVLILGSGLVGSALERALKHKVDVVMVRSRVHVDLRVPGILNEFLCGRKIDFVFFCAFDVGGAKYLESMDANLQTAMLRANTQLYLGVFEWLRQTQVPFVFFSSFRKHEDSVYGALKRVGEQWTKYLHNGRVARLWNSYGFEPISPRSHVLVDWIDQCYRHGVVHALTDGNEMRQFCFVEDAVDAFVLMMEHFDELEFAVDVASGTWVSLRQLGSVVEQVSADMGRPCSIHWASTPARSNVLVDPDLDSVIHRRWVAKYSLFDGVRLTYEQFVRSLADPAGHADSEFV